jgi:asparagine synthase (glutamine-hydrolysing)
MCGIAGLLHGGASTARLEPTLARMWPGIESRGPDGRGQLLDAGVGLLHARLAIIDLETGEQPIWNEDRTVGCVFNGEIYNYRALRRELQARGHVLSTKSDTEVLVHLYEDHGDDLVDHVHGMFAFAIWDARRRRALLARDRYGIKPLYLADIDGGLAFASSIASLLAAGASRDPDPDALAEYFRFSKVGEPRTAFRSIRTLLPGHTLSFDVTTGATRTHRFHRPPRRHPVPRDVEENVAAARRAFEGAVSSHLVADVEVGAFLSGGIDSTLVVAEAQRRAGRPLRTFCVDFPGRHASSEAAFAARVAKAIGTRHTTIEVTAPPQELLRETVAATGQPFAIASFVPLLALCRRAVADVKVVLTGDGGDEVGLGYPWYRWAHEVHGRGPSLRSEAVADVLHRIERGAARIRVIRRAAKLARGAVLGGASGANAWRYDLSSDEARALLNPALRPVGAARRSPNEDVWDGSLEELEALRMCDLEVLLRDEMLPKLDRAGMAVGLEGRVPLLDDAFVDAMMAVPIERHMAHREGKALLRAWGAELCPELDVVRPKHGFDVPIQEWLDGGLRDDVERLLLSDRPMGLVDRVAARKVVARMRSGVPGAAHAVYTLLLSELWFETVGRSGA